MQNKTIIVIAIVLAAAGIGTYFYFKSKKDTDALPSSDTDENKPSDGLIGQDVPNTDIVNNLEQPKTEPAVIKPEPAVVLLSTGKSDIIGIVPANMRDAWQTANNKMSDAEAENIYAYLVYHYQGRGNQAPPELYQEYLKLKFKYRLPSI